MLHKEGFRVQSKQQSANAQVRSAAYGAMACWGFETLELLEVQKPLRDYSGLLLGETDGEARGKCEALVIRALAYEHARRRRWALIAGWC